MAMDSTTSVRLLDARDALEFGAAVEGVTRSEFIREAIRERADRLEREMSTTTNEGEK